MSQNNEKLIAEVREDIDEVDTRILELLAERRALSLRMARVKGRVDRPSRDMTREESLIAERVSAGEDYGLDPGLVVRLWRSIVNDSVRIQQEALGRSDAAEGKVTVAIQGIEGSYSHLAAENFFGTKGLEAAYLTLPTFSDALEAVAAGQADAAVLPIDNTTSGAIS